MTTLTSFFFTRNQYEITRKVVRLNRIIKSKVVVAEHERGRRPRNGRRVS